MNIPDLNSAIETFIKIDYSADVPRLMNWQHYIELLRSRVAPLLRALSNEGMITWYSFLVHDRQSGVPAPDGDDGYYVHVRMALADSVDTSEFIRRLPAYCLMTRTMTVPDPPSLDTVDIGSLVDDRVEQGWKILGESSEWVLRLLESHDPAKPIPLQNVSQFLHYLGNQLFVRVAKIRMP
jgi:hypothetical protein